MIAARDFNGAFAGFRARVAEEHALRKRQPHELLGHRLLALDPVEIRCVPQLPGLPHQRRNQTRVGMTQGIDRNAGAKIEIALARCGDQPRAFTAREHKILTGIGSHHGV